MEKLNQTNCSYWGLEDTIRQAMVALFRSWVVLTGVGVVVEGRRLLRRDLALDDGDGDGVAPETVLGGQREGRQLRLAHLVHLQRGAHPVPLNRLQQVSKS